MSIRERFSRNERNRRTIERGKAPRQERVAAEVKSRTPIIRNRVNPATGRPHRDDVRLHKGRDENLAHWKQARNRAAAGERPGWQGNERTPEYRKLCEDGARKTRTEQAARQRAGRAGR